MITKHCIRTSLALGAIINESKKSVTKADFVHNLSVALKDAADPEFRMGLLIALGITEKMETHELDALMKSDVKALSEAIKAE